MIYAGPGRRLLGFVLDFSLLTLLVALFLPLAGISVEQLAVTDFSRSLQLTLFLVVAGGQIAFTAWRGQTPGKMIVRIRVVDHATGRIPTLASAAVRWLIPACVSLSGSLTIVAWLLIYGWLLFDSRRQGLHDKVARTVVVDALLPPVLPDDGDMDEDLTTRT